MQVASVSDPGSPIVNNMPLVASTAVLACAVACAVTLTSTAALSACNTTVRGELVAGDAPGERFGVRPEKLLFFSVTEITEENGVKVERSFQSFTLGNTKTTFPIPFELHVDSPRDCPKESTLSVQGSDHDGLHYSFRLNGRKTIRLEKTEFETLRVFSPSF